MFEIGNSLREARVRQGLGYPEIELATKIRGKYIRALEDEDFAALPADTYVRGFLRAYAEELGLDGQVYVDEYVSRFGQSRREELPEPGRRSHGPAVERRAVVLALAGIAALAALVIVAWRFGGVDSSSTTPPVVPATDAAVTSAARSLLVLHGVGKGSYVEVRRNSPAGHVVLQATVPGGGTDELDGTRFYLLVRRPAGLRVTLGGKTVPLPAHRNLRVVVTPERTIRLHG